MAQEEESGPGTRPTPLRHRQLVILMGAVLATADGQDVVSEFRVYLSICLLTILFINSVFLQLPI